MTEILTTPSGKSAQFEPTRWSLVLRSRGQNSAERRRALGELCAAYWYPLYAFLRRSGRGVEDAQDLTQDFFARLMEGTLLADADPARGKFRTLLLAALKNMDANAWNAARAQKRGGGAEVVPLDVAMAEDRWMAEPAGGPAEAAFDRAWANTVMDRAGAQLQAEYVAGGKAALFTELFPRLNGGNAADGLAAVAERLGMTEASVKMALSRMRPRYADALRAEIGHTVGSHGDVQEELRYLLTVFL
jgi:DNA-directed RNA polymerase specialized sigma24 family protein